MKSNFSLTNTASGKPEHIAPGATHLQRRQVLKGALGGVATLGLGSLGLTACGGSDARYAPIATRSSAVSSSTIGFIRAFHLATSFN